jgi:hypothetical protein
MTDPLAQAVLATPELLAALEVTDALEAGYVLVLNGATWPRFPADANSVDLVAYGVGGRQGASDLGRNGLPTVVSGSRRRRCSARRPDPTGAGGTTRPSGGGAIRAARP